MYHDREDYKKILIDNGAINIQDYCLINNWGFSYDLDGKHYDSRFWANCYGACINRFITMPKNEKIDKLLNNIDN